jgi:DNA-binding CsgD family transcriptional regulator
MADIPPVRQWAWWRTALIYGALLAVAAAGLQWLQFRLLAHTHPVAVYLALFALGCMALGGWVAWRLMHRAAPTPFEVNTRAQQSLGISEREFEVLGLLAAGRSNKQIARQLEISPNTVKTHVARLFEKLEARRRTQAIGRARELGLVR